MTIDEAKSKLAEIKPEADKLWDEVQLIQAQLKPVQSRWCDLYNEVHKLETFISVSCDEK